MPERGNAIQLSKLAVQAYSSAPYKRLCRIL